MFFGFHLGLAYVEIFHAPCQIERIDPPFLGISVGRATGMLGCWLSLRQRLLRSQAAMYFGIADTQWLLCFFSYSVLSVR